MNGFLTLVVKSGNKLAAKDRGGTSDPYVKVGLISAKGTPLHPIPTTDISAPVMKTLDPEWHFHKKFQMVAGPSTILRIEVWDKNKLMADHFMGSYEVDVTTLKLFHEEVKEFKDIALVTDPKYPKETVAGTIFFTLSFFDDDFARRRISLLNRKGAGEWLIIGTSFEELTIMPALPLLPNGEIDMKKWKLPEYQVKTTRKEYAWTGKVSISEGNVAQLSDEPLKRTQTGDGLSVEIVQDSGSGHISTTDGGTWSLKTVGAGIESHFYGRIIWDKTDDMFRATGTLYLDSETSMPQGIIRSFDLKFFQQDK